MMIGINTPQVISFAGKTDKTVLNQVDKELKELQKTERQRKKDAKKAYKESKQGQKDKLIKKSKRRIYAKSYGKVNAAGAIPLVGASILVGNPLPLLGLGVVNYVKLFWDIGNESKRAPRVKAKEAEKLINENFDRLIEEAEQKNNEENSSKTDIDLSEGNY